MIGQRGFVMVSIYASVLHCEAGGSNTQGRKHKGHLLEALLSHVKHWKEKQASGAEGKVQA